MNQSTEQAHSRTSMGELLGAFAFASDLAFGLELEDSLRSCYAGMRLADELSLPGAERFNVYYTALLKDAGCTSWTSDLYRAFHTTDEIAARRQYWFGTDRTSESSLRAWLAEHIATELSGSELGSSESTVRHHLEHIYERPTPPAASPLPSSPSRTASSNRHSPHSHDVTLGVVQGRRPCRVSVRGCPSHHIPKSEAEQRESDAQWAAARPCGTRHRLTLFWDS